MEQQCFDHESIVQNNGNNLLVRAMEAEFHDAVEDNNPFADAFNSDHSHSISDDDSSNDDESTVYVLSEHTPDSTSSPSSSGLRRRRTLPNWSSEDISQSHFFKNNPDCLIDFDRLSRRKNYKRSWSVNDNKEKLKVKQDDMTSASSAITSVCSNGRSNDESITINSPNSLPILLLTLAELVLKVLGFQTHSFANPLTFPIWLMQISYILVSDPLSIVYQWIEKRKFTWNSCLPTTHGVLWLAYSFFIIAGFIASSFLLSGIMMKWIVSEPIEMTEELIFDYSIDTPMAFVPIISCSNSSSPGLIETSKIGGTGLQVLQFDREVQATVSLTLPESDYNRNLGIFQVRVDFLSGDGEPLASIRQPSMLPFKSEPIRLLWTFFKLAPLLTGYSSESETLDITFRGYTEKNVPTSCSRVVIEQRAEFAGGGGIPEIYAASLKLEARHPFWKRVLWYWKGVIYMGMTSIMLTVELLFMLLCRPIVFPSQRRAVVSSG